MRTSAVMVPRGRTARSDPRNDLGQGNLVLIRLWKEVAEGLRQGETFARILRESTAVSYCIMRLYADPHGNMQRAVGLPLR